MFSKARDPDEHSTSFRFAFRNTSEFRPGSCPLWQMRSFWRATLVHTKKVRCHFDRHDADFGLARFSPRKDLGGWPVPVYFVPGNHEYDGMPFEEAHEKLKAACERLQIIFLHQRIEILKVCGL
jgi:hypothetical protein